MKYWISWFLDRFRFAFAGIRYGIAKDKSIRFQFVCGVIVIIFGFFLSLTVRDWLWILLCITLVITAEVFNSCLEKTVDYICMDKTEQARQIKDMAAGAVLITSIFSAVVAVIIFTPYVLKLLGIGG